MRDIGSLFFALVVIAPPASAAEPSSARKLHALLAIDTASDLRTSVLVDQRRIERLLKANIPSARLDVKIIAGTQLSSNAILTYYRDLKIGPDDTLLFYYAGHGAKDPEKGHAFLPQLGKVAPVYRSDVREAMRKTDANLVVILTDCCSTKSRLAGKPFYGSVRPVTPTSATGIHPTLNHLFFGHRGVIDVTAAEDGEGSWSDLKDGGVFTRTLAKQLLRTTSDLDTDADKFVTWKEFFPVLKKDVEGTYKSWAAKMRSIGESVNQPDQRPKAFSLGEPIAASAMKPEPAVRVYAVVCFVNESGEDVSFKYRFTGQDEWESAKIAIRERGEYSAPQGKSSELPRFEIRIEGNQSTTELEADYWSGTGKPPRGAAGREYPILLRKNGK